MNESKFREALRTLPTWKLVQGGEELIFVRLSDVQDALAASQDDEGEK